MAPSYYYAAQSRNRDTPPPDVPDMVYLAGVRGAAAEHIGLTPTPA